MGLGSIGVPGLILILVVALLLFGPNKLPELGRAFGKTLREFKKGTREMLDDVEDKPKAQDQVASIEDNSKKERRLPD